MLRSNLLHGLQYCEYYCEENIWQLCAQSKFIGNAWVLFISSPKNQFVIWNQKVAEPGEAMVWDYHVILLKEEKGTFNIFDFDTCLDFGCDAQHYFENSFPLAEIPEDLRPTFLVQKASEFRNNFKSNREHMKDELGNFLKPEPAWERVSEDSNLAQYLEMDSKRDTIWCLDDIRKNPFSDLIERCGKI